MLDLKKDKEFIYDSIRGQVIEDIYQYMEKYLLDVNGLAEKLGWDYDKTLDFLNEKIDLNIELLIEISVKLEMSLHIRLCNEGNSMLVDTIENIQKTIELRNFQNLSIKEQLEFLKETNELTKNHSIHFGKE